MSEFTNSLWTECDSQKTGVMPSVVVLIIAMRCITGDTGLGVAGGERWEVTRAGDDPPEKQTLTITLTSDRHCNPRLSALNFRFHPLYGV